MTFIIILGIFLIIYPAVVFFFHKKFKKIFPKSYDFFFVSPLKEVAHLEKERV